ncbi:MAG: DUF5320 domain-containing protein [Thermoproteota archaeon]
MPYGIGPWGWFPGQYVYPYWGWGRCRWFPWLPRWWWTGIYGPISPYYRPMTPPISKEEEVAMLEQEAKFLELELAQIKKRLEELKK